MRLGLGGILACVLLLGALAWRQAGLLWLQTNDLYAHPFQVRGALGALRAETQAIHRDMKDLVLAANEQEIAAALQDIETHKASAFRQFDVLQDRYLGPPGDVTSLHDEFVKWNAVREETIRLIRAGRTVEAAARTKHGGTGDAEAEAVMGRIRVVDNFARNRAAQFYRAATEQKDFLNRQLVVAMTATLVLFLIVFYLLLTEIKDPLQQLTAAAGKFRQGKLDVRSQYVSANEFGELSASFNNLADTIETRLRIDEQAVQLAAVMARETETRAFCRELLKALIEHTGSQIGAVYLLNPRRTEFEHFESIGLSAAGRASFSAAAREGEFGLALASGRMQRITEIPADTRFSLTAVSGEFRPREIITIPLLGGEEETAAVISLASLRPFDARAVRLLEEVWSTLTARMNGVLGHQQVRDLAARLEGQNRELETQKQELAAQADELIEMNTELEMQKRQVDEANRLKSVFLSNMSHELRTPLNSVIALSGVLNRRLGRTLPKEERGYLDVIERNGKHLLALINDILDLSRIEADREELNPARFSVRTLAGEVVAMIEPQAREKNITLTNLVGDDLPLVYSDPDKCQHILQNLVGNAVKFTEAGTVEVSARHVDDEIHVAIRDTGIGIAADQLPHIFDEFRQTDAGASRKYGGTGLGLAIAKKYAELLHGGITVESAPGSGSTFTLRLPVTLYPYSDGADAAAPPGDSPGVTVAGPSAVGQGQRILLVEDNEPAVTQISEILTGQGYRVHVTRNGKEALQQIEQAPPDAVILDLMMPEMDGFEVLKAIRGSEKTAHLPVLILTAKHVSREELSFLKGNHVHQLIQKGDVSRTELLAAIERMVAPRETPAPRRRRLDRKRPPGQAVILVVEDNPDNLRTMRALLQGTYTLLEATDGWAAVEQARRYAPDLILMDIALPVIDGFAVLAAIREDVALRNTAVVAVTASAMKGDREDILARGFDGYISKPVDEKLLLETIRGMLYGD